MRTCNSEEQDIIDEKGPIYHSQKKRSRERENTLDEVVQSLNQIKNRSKEWDNKAVLAKFAKFRRKRPHRIAYLKLPNSMTQTVGSSSNSSGSMFDDHFDVSCFPLQGIPNTDLLENSSGTCVEDNFLIQDFDFIGNLEQDNFDFSDNSDPFN